MEEYRIRCDIEGVWSRLQRPVGENKIKLDKVELDGSLESFCSSCLTKTFIQERSIRIMVDWSQARYRPLFFGLHEKVLGSH